MKLQSKFEITICTAFSSYEIEIRFFNKLEQLNGLFGARLFKKRLKTPFVRQASGLGATDDALGGMVP